MTWTWLGLALFLMVNGGVIELTDDTIDEYIQKSPIIMILYYAPWCTKSKAFLKEYTKAAEKIEILKKPFVLGQIDASSEIETADKMNLDSYPVLRLYLNSTEIKYDKELKEEAVLHFIEKQIRPPSLFLNSPIELQTVIEARGVKLLLIYENEAVLEEFIATTKLLKEFPFYHTSPELAEQILGAKFSAPNTVVLLMKESENWKTLTEKFTAKSLEEFVRDHQFPLINSFSQETLTQIMKPEGRIGVILYRSAEDPKASSMEEEFKQFATKFQSTKHLFIISDIKGDVDQRVANFFGITEEKIPFMLVTKKVEDMAKFEYRGELTKEGMSQYLTGVLEGKISRTIKSEAEPQSNPGPVYKIVGKTFTRDVIDNDLDVFVKFYTPWCGHCKELAPIYEELAKSLSKNQFLKIVEVDVSSNETPGYNIQSFPTLMFFPGNKKKEPITFEEARTISEMTAFLKTNCYHQLLD